MGPLAVTALALAATALSAAAAPQSRLVAHLIPHSHCDEGWLMSYEQYYQQQVHAILTSVTNELKDHPERRFVWAESSFLLRWLEVQPERVKADFRRMVQTGQIEFVGGGWVQHDEANPDTAAIVGQLTEGHEYLVSLFGKRPRIQWSIDPFGSAAATAALSAAAGYDALVINRIDYELKDALKSRAAMEFVWKPYAQPGPSSYFSSSSAAGAAGAPQPPHSSSHASSSSSLTGHGSDSEGSWHRAETGGIGLLNSSIFTHVLHTHYSAPRTFDFENGESPHIGEHNLRERAASLADELRRRALSYRSSHLLVPFGDDFKFQRADAQFSNMDQLVRYINSHNAEDTAPSDAMKGLTIRYSTLSEYFDSVHAEAQGRGREFTLPCPAGIENAQLVQRGGMAKTAAEKEKEKQEKEEEESGKSASSSSSSMSTRAQIVFPVLAASPLDAGVDFFNYADNGDSYWVGYYTSRPLLKQLIRRSAATLKAADSLAALARPWAGAWQQSACALITASTQGQTAEEALQGPAGGGVSKPAANAAAVAAGAGQSEAALDEASLSKAVLGLSSGPYWSYSWLAAFQRLEQARLDAALCLHHDAITGTSRDTVVDDYIDRMVSGIESSTAVLTDMASLLLGGLPKALRRAKEAITGGSKGSPAAAGPAAVAAEALQAETLAPAPLTHAPHLLPVADKMQLLFHSPSSSASSSSSSGKGASSLALHPSTPGFPVVVYNPTGWSRQAQVSVLAAVGCSPSSHPSSWPAALVVDSAGRPLPSQWLATVESSSAGKEAAEATASRVVGLPGGQPVTSAAFACSKTRHELVIQVPMEGLSLRTVFVSLAWEVELLQVTAAGGDMQPMAASTAAEARKAFFALPASTLIMTAGPQQQTLDLSPPEGGDIRGRVPLEKQPRLALAEAAAVQRVATSAMRNDNGALLLSLPMPEPAPGSLLLENACLRVEVSGETGLLQAVTYKWGRLPGPLPSSKPAATTKQSFQPVRVKAAQTMAAYHTSNSGAYLFRPQNPPVPLEQSNSAAGQKTPDVTVTISSSLLKGEQSGGAGDHDSGIAALAGLQQTVRVLGPRFSQTIALKDTLQWHKGLAAAAAAAGAGQGSTAEEQMEALRQRCNDPLLPDGTIDIRPTVSASDDSEVVLLLDTDLDLSTAAVPPVQLEREGSKADMEDQRQSPNLRDNIHSRTWNPKWVPPHQAAVGVPVHAEAAAAGGAAAGGTTGMCSSAMPMGWWTSDGVGLLRRRPAPQHTPASQMQKHYYPMSILSRFSGVAAGSYEAIAGATSQLKKHMGLPLGWLTLFTAQPFGTGAQVTSADPNGNVKLAGSRMEVMLHRKLMRDDGRGLATGVLDGTVITARLLLSFRGDWVQPEGFGCMGAAEGKGTAAAAGAGGAAALPLLERVVHEDWLWTWQTRSALHHQQVVHLHADLLGLHVDKAMVLGSQKGAVKEKEGQKQLLYHFASAAGLAKQEVPLDASTHMAALSATISEPALPRSSWMARFSTDYSAMAAGEGGAAGSGAGAGVGAGAAVSPAVPAHADAEEVLEKHCRGNARFAREVICSYLLQQAQQQGGKMALPSSSPLSSSMPAWMHVFSLQARDGTSDDILFRLQNFGGMETHVDISRVLTGGSSLSSPASSSASSSAFAPVHIVSVKPRSLTLNRDEELLQEQGTAAAAAAAAAGSAGKASRGRLYWPHASDEAVSGGAASLGEGYIAGDIMSLLHTPQNDVRKAAAEDLKGRGAESIALRFASALNLQLADLGSGESQNTKEAGVFLSDAALQKMEEDARRAAAESSGGAVQGRKLLGILDMLKRRAGLSSSSSSSVSSQGGNGAAAVGTALMSASSSAFSSFQGSFHALLQPASIRTFLVALDAADDGLVELLQRGAAGEQSFPAGGQAAAAAGAGAAAGVAAPASQQQGGEEQSEQAKKLLAGVADLGVSSIAQLKGLIEQMLPASTKVTTLDTASQQQQRRSMLEKIEKLQPLTGQEISTLYRLSRLTSRKHNQPAPANLQELISAVLQRRRQQQASGGKEGGAAAGAGATAGSLSALSEEEEAELLRLSFMAKQASKQAGQPQLKQPGALKDSWLTEMKEFQDFAARVAHGAHGAQGGGKGAAGTAGTASTEDALHPGLSGKELQEKEQEEQEAALRVLLKAVSSRRAIEQRAAKAAAEAALAAAAFKEKQKQQGGVQEDSANVDSALAAAEAAAGEGSAAAAGAEADLDPEAAAAEALRAAAEARQALEALVQRGRADIMSAGAGRQGKGKRSSSVTSGLAGGQDTAAAAGGQSEGESEEEEGEEEEDGDRLAAAFDRLEDGDEALQLQVGLSAEAEAENAAFLIAFLLLVVLVSLAAICCWPSGRAGADASLLPLSAAAGSGTASVAAAGGILGRLAAVYVTGLQSFKRAANPAKEK